MIRRIVDFGNASDAKKLLDIAAKFLSEGGFPPREDHVALQMSAIESAGIGAFWLYEGEDGTPRGMAGAVIAPSLYDAKVEATELIWYVEKPYRGSPGCIRLLHTIIEWAKAIGASRVRFAALAAMPESASIYERLGMSKIETYYGKEL